MQPMWPLMQKNAASGSPSHENAISNNQQHPTVLQWPYTPQHVEQSSLNSRPYVSTQLPSPAVVNQCQQLSHLQPNSASNQVPQGQPPMHLAQSTMPFWLPPQSGYQFSGVNMPATFQTFTPLGTVNGSCQGPAVIRGVTSSSNQPQVPNVCYPVAYPYPGFPGPNWDPSSWCVQGQQSQLPCMYSSPGGYGYFSSMPLMVPALSASAGQPFQREIIRPTTKLSQKHQQLWMQSAENVQLWTVIGQLQSELADYKNRLKKLEAEVLYLKPALEEPIAQVTGTAIAGKPSKRGRPRKSAVSVDVLPTADESYPRARGRKPAATCKVQSSEARTHIFEKVSLHKVEDKEKASHSPATISTNNCDNMEVNGNSMIRPAFNNQVHQENPGNQICDKADDSKTSFSILSEQARASSATHIGNTTNRSFVWPSNIIPESCGRTVFNMISQGFYDNSSIIRQGEKHTPKWSFVDEENASEQLEDTIVKDEKEEEIGDDTSSGGEEEIAPTK